MAKKNSKKNHVYVIEGDDRPYVDFKCDRLIEKLLKPDQRATGLYKADPGEVTVQHILDELRTLPFLSEKRVVVLEQADKFISANRTVLEKYFDNPSTTGILLLTVNKWDARTKLAKKLPKIGKLITAKQPKGKNLQSRLRKYAAEVCNKQLAPAAAELLIELAGDETARLYSEIEKLALYENESKIITEKHIEDIIGHNRFFNAFNVIDACLTGDTAGAVERLRNMFAEDKSTEYTVVGAFAYHARKMFNAKVMLENGNNEKYVSDKLGIWSNKNSFFRQVRTLRLKKIGNIINQLANIDYAVKTGRTSAPVAMEQLVLKLASI